MADAIAVTALGMVSALGRDVVTSCAAARAGLRRMTELEGLEVMAPGSDDAQPVTGHPAAGYTDGFGGLGRLARLGAGALADLAASAWVADWTGTGLILALPSGYYRRAAARLEPGRAAEIEEDLNAQREALEQELADKVVRLARVPIPATRQRLIFGDQAGFVEALWTAVWALEQGKLTRCVVGGIDSYLEPDVLNALFALDILKTPDNPAGLVPGECAAFLLLETAASARARGAPILAQLGGLARATESVDRTAEKPAVGVGLATAAAVTLEQLGAGPLGPRFVIGSLNGDVHRARDWGYAAVRLQGRKLLAAYEDWHPALSFGDVGAATGPAAACLAARAFARGYAPAPAALVWLAADDGGRGSVYVRRDS